MQITCTKIYIILARDEIGVFVHHTPFNPDFVTNRNTCQLGEVGPYSYSNGKYFGMIVDISREKVFQTKGRKEKNLLNLFLNSSNPLPFLNLRFWGA